MVTIPSWKRERYERGGGDALLLYVVFGDLPAEHSQPLDATRYRSRGLVTGAHASHYTQTTHPGVLADFRSGYVWDQLQVSDPSLARQVAASRTCVIVRADIPDPSTLDYLRDTIGVVTFLIDLGGCCVYDPQMFKWWSPAEWRNSIFEPAGPVPRHHVTILISEETDTTDWLHTRGMRKLGRPDVSVHHVSRLLRPAVTDLCDRLIEHQAFGAIVPEGQEVRMASLPSGGRIFRGGHLDDPEFNNVHLEVRWQDA